MKVDLQNPVSVDFLLNEILNCQGTWDFDRLSMRVYPAEALGNSHTLLLRWLKRRAIMRSEYAGPAAEGLRQNRAGKPWSWSEEKIMKWAFVEVSSEKKEPTEEKIAVLLQRTVEEVKEKRKTRNGIRGFDL